MKEGTAGHSAAGKTAIALPTAALAGSAAKKDRLEAAAAGVKAVAAGTDALLENSLFAFYAHRRARPGRLNRERR